MKARQGLPWRSPVDEKTEPQRLSRVLPKATQPVVTDTGQTLKLPVSIQRAVIGLKKVNSREMQSPSVPTESLDES